MEQRIRLEPNPYSAREARRFIDRALGGWDGPERRDYAVLLVNELVVNAIQHAHTTLEVRVAVDPERIEIAVRDEDPRLPTPRHPDVTDEHGRGLLTVDALADDWGVRPEADGKTVWFGLTAGTTRSRRP
jgi:anti-sigma regulatory factor (Ser/Thr protein kinase)